MDTPNLFSSWFSLIYTKLANFNGSIIDNILNSINISIYDISVTEVFDVLTMLKCDFTSDPDSIPPI